MLLLLLKSINKNISEGCGGFGWMAPWLLSSLVLSRDELRAVDLTDLPVGDKSLKRHASFRYLSLSGGKKNKLMKYFHFQVIFQIYAHFHNAESYCQPVCPVKFPWEQSFCTNTALWQKGFVFSCSLPVRWWRSLSFTKVIMGTF